MTRDNLRALAAPALLAVLLGTVPALAAAPVRDLGSCQRLAERSPAEALAAVKEWAGHGGGDQARLCRAIALFHNEEFAAAGEAFEALATGGQRTDRQIAELYDRAAWAYLRAGNAGHAESLYGRALEKLPDDPEFHIDRGIARAEDRKYREAVEDFTAALKKQPRRADAYYYRAAAYRELTKLKDAFDDVEQSLRLKPGDAEALVLRGKLRATMGDAAGARLDWREVVRRDPDAPVGRAAAAALRRLDNPEPAPAKP